LDLFEANVTWVDKMFDGEDNEHPLEENLRHWRLTWTMGTMALTPKGTEEEAWCHAARFIYLWLLGVRCDIADHLAHHEAFCLRSWREKQDG
jgi:hypothetical protein